MPKTKKKTKKKGDPLPVVTGDVDVGKLTKRIEARLSVAGVLEVADALALAEALRERLPDDLALMGDGPEIEELVELCSVVSALWSDRERLGVTS